MSTQRPEPSNIDWFILLPIVALLLFSVAFVYSASAAFADVKMGSSEGMAWNHAIRVMLGLVIMLFVAKIDYRIFERASSTIMLIAYGFLFMVLVMGVSQKGASRWVQLGPLNFQPSELAKYAVVLHAAVLLSANQARVRTWKHGMMPVLMWSLPVSVLIALQPNLSTASVIFLIVAVMMFLADVKVSHLVGLGATGFTAAVSRSSHRANWRVPSAMTILRSTTSCCFTWCSGRPCRTSRSMRSPISGMRNAGS